MPRCVGRWTSAPDLRAEKRPAPSRVTTHPDDPDRIAVRLGALDHDPDDRVRVHQFVAYAAPWARVPDDGLCRDRARHTRQRYAVDVVTILDQLGDEQALVGGTR